jgi:hypothetical protein
MDKLLKLLTEGTEIEQIQELACEVLIEKDGHPAWDNMEILRLNGYPVVPVEQDRFGWLLGGIETDNGLIIYG